MEPAERPSYENRSYGIEAWVRRDRKGDSFLEVAVGETRLLAYPTRTGKPDWPQLKGAGIAVWIHEDGKGHRLSLQIEDYGFITAFYVGGPSLLELVRYGRSEPSPPRRVYKSTDPDLEEALIQAVERLQGPGGAVTLERVASAFSNIPGEEIEMVLRRLVSKGAVTSPKEGLYRA
jgi:hypothetical protein